jgi:hypothetical protein
LSAATGGVMPSRDVSYFMDLYFIFSHIDMATVKDLKADFRLTKLLKVENVIFKF